MLANDLSELQARSMIPRWTFWLNTHSAKLPTNADDTLAIYGADRRTIRYSPGSLGLPPVYLRLI